VGPRRIFLNPGCSRAGKTATAFCSYFQFFRLDKDEVVHILHAISLSQPSFKRVSGLPV
jgi:hypothetical protein